MLIFLSKKIRLLYYINPWKSLQCINELCKNCGTACSGKNRPFECEHITCRIVLYKRDAYCILYNRTMRQSSTKNLSAQRRKRNFFVFLLLENIVERILAGKNQLIPIAAHAGNICL